jgi:multiple antibiotic resistance protein
VTFFDAALFGEVFVTLSVIMDPPGVIPLFLSLTSGRTAKVRRRVAWQAALVAFFVITVFALFGQSILNYLHITLAALRISGGLLLLLVALELLTGREEEPSQTADVNVALVPLGTPLLAGPGAIVATMVFAQGADAPRRIVSVGLAIVAVHIVLWLTMCYSVVILRVIKDSGVVLITRIAGLLLSAIAVQLVADGVFEYIRGGVPG